VAVNMPAQQQTANTAQQMQQMAAQGVQQPVQMAIGGLAAYAKGGYHSGDSYGPYSASYTNAMRGVANDSSLTDRYNLPSYSSDPTVEDFNALGARFKKIKSDVQGIGSLKEPTEDKIEPTVTAPSTPSSSELPKGDISTWSDSDIENVADDIVSRGTQGRTPFARGIQSLLGTKAPDRSAVVERLRNERDQEIQSNANKPASIIPSDRDAELAKAQGDFAKRQEAVGRAIEANPVKSIFEEQTPEERNTAIAIQNAAASNAVDKAMNPPTISEAQTAGGSGDYMSNAPSGGIASIPPTISNIPPTISEAQTAGGSGDYMTNAPSGVASLPQATGTPQGSLDAAEAAQPITSATGTPQGSLDGVAAPSAPAAPGQPQASDAATKALNTYNAGSSAKPSDTDTTGGLTMEDIKARRNQERQDNFNMALMQAGLAIAGGKSSNALTNIGEGGVSGVQAFAKGEQESRVLERERMADLRAIQQMKNEQAYRQATLSNEASRLGISQQELQTRLNEQAFKQGPEFEYLQKKAAEDRQARIDMRTQTNLTAAVSRHQVATTQLGAQLDTILRDLSDPVKANDPNLIARKNDIQKRLQYESDLLKVAQKQAGLNVGDVPLPEDTSGSNQADPLGIRKK